MSDTNSQDNLLPVPSRRTHGKEQTSSSVGRTNGMSNSSSFTDERPKKAVSIDEPDMISPMMLGKNKETHDNFNLDGQSSSRQFSAKLGKRLHGRHNAQQVPDTPATTSSSVYDGSNDIAELGGSGHGVHHVFKDIHAWLHEEKVRRKARKAQRKHRGLRKGSNLQEVKEDEVQESSANDRRLSESSSSGDSDAFERLQGILERSASGNILDRNGSKKQSVKVGRRSSTKKSRVYSSDVDVDIDDAPPSCNVILDNSKTLTYYGGSSSTHADITAKPASKDDREEWLNFKSEIVRLAHTLKLKGWRQVPLEQYAHIDVERLSGALTNAVYVIAPPEDQYLKPTETADGSQSLAPRKSPPKLLLRIYGPQVEHLIDREAELRILRRLARKRIGPRMLGTFKNGRFEEFFHARTLKPQDLRDPATSKQIAKRMRELHEGIELLEEERDAGPFVWRNWDSWLERCEKIVTHLDQQVVTGKSDSDASVEDVTKRGLVCGTDWKLFKRTVGKYRAWLDEQYGGADRLREQLVFAHNDTQYGNILRLEPPGESPLMLPANQHKQLIVIDFEYSNANMPGLEFANHFTEWCYNYHDATSSFVCQTSAYPSIEEQRRFIRAYVVHRPQHAPAAISTPRLLPRELTMSTTSLSSSKAIPVPTSRSSTASATIVERPSLSSSFSQFTLDSRPPHPQSQTNTRPQAISRPQSSYFDTSSSLTTEPNEMTDPADEEEIEAEITGLMHEARLWRLANSAQWVAWGVVQAHVPGLEHLSVAPALETSSSTSSAQTTPRVQPAAEDTPSTHAHPSVSVSGGSDPLTGDAAAAAQDLADKRPEEADAAEDEEENEGFDYLSYARERALFFWGDALQFGFVTEEELEVFGLGVAGGSGGVKVVDF